MKLEWIENGLLACAFIPPGTSWAVKLETHERYNGKNTILIGQEKLIIELCLYLHGTRHHLADYTGQEEALIELRSLVKALESGDRQDYTVTSKVLDK